MSALPTKIVLWTRGGEIGASSVASRSVWQLEWFGKVCKVQYFNNNIKQKGKWQIPYQSVKMFNWTPKTRVCSESKHRQNEDVRVNTWCLLFPQLLERIAWKDGEAAYHQSLKASKTPHPLYRQWAWLLRSSGPTSTQTLLLEIWIILRWAQAGFLFFCSSVSYALNDTKLPFGLCSFSTSRRKSAQTRRRTRVTSSSSTTSSLLLWRWSGSGRRTSQVSLTSAWRIRNCC